MLSIVTLSVFTYALRIALAGTVDALILAELSRLQSHAEATDIDRKRASERRRSKGGNLGTSTPAYRDGGALTKSKHVPSVLLFLVLAKLRQFERRTRNRSRTYWWLRRALTQLSACVRSPNERRW